ncbi:chemotaxis protein CheX [bacterium]|nr:chemotaxis protein CheX [bacterium]
MKVEYINPFVEGVNNLFTTMLDCEAKRGNVGVVQDNDPPTQSIVAIIGLSGSVRGCVTMVFPARTAMHVAHRLLGSTIDKLDQDVMDAMAEMVNVVAGAAKAKLNEDENSPAQLSLPTVILGRDYRIQHPSWSVWLDIPFDSPLGPFNLCVSIETDHSRKGVA